jgi:hypothetical protein
LHHEHARSVNGRQAASDSQEVQPTPGFGPPGEERPAEDQVLSQRTRTMAKEGTDTRDIRSGAYDPVSIDGLPQPNQVRDKTTPHEQQQWGADVRAEALPGTAPVLPEGLRRPRKGPLNRSTGRRISS